MARLWNEPFLKTILPTLLLVVAGVGCLAWTGWRAWDLAWLLLRAERTTGVVVDARQHQHVRFTASDGRSVEFVQNGGLDRALGAAVPVAYDPADPAGTAVADTVWATWVPALWMLPAGLGFTILPALGFRGEWRAGR